MSDYPPISTLEWGIKRIDPDLTTGRRREGAAVIRWPVQTGGWVTHPTANRHDHSGEACGVGLHLARTWEAASLGGCLTSALCVVVGWYLDDVLGEGNGKVRVTRCFVVSQAVDGFVAVVRAQGRDANLGGADLWGADLGGANFGGANFGGANLWGANLGGANLGGANLRGANLGGANLWGANLRGANLRDADLWDADLRDANLRGADLWGANLGGANLRGANLRDADLRDANLRDANANARTVWPDGFDAEAAGVNVR